MTLDPQDQLDILTLINRADAAATDRDVTTYLSLFTPDAVITGAPGGHDLGVTAEALQSTWDREPASRTHLTANAWISSATTRDGGPVTARSILVIARIGIDPVVDLIAPIHHELRRTDDGWKFQRRSVGPPGSEPATSSPNSR